MARRNDTDPMPPLIVRLILAHMHPKPCRLSYLDYILGNRSNTINALTSLDAIVWEDDGKCGITDEEAERLMKQEQRLEEIGMWA